jgi:hypothetical protein
MECPSFHETEEYIKENKTVLPLTSDEQSVVFKIIVGMCCARCKGCKTIIVFDRDQPCCLFSVVNHLIDMNENVAKIGNHTLYKLDDRHYVYEYIL